MVIYSSRRDTPQHSTQGCLPGIVSVMNHVMSHPAAILRSYPTNASVNEGYCAGETHEMDLVATDKGSKQLDKSRCGAVNLPRGSFVRDTICLMPLQKSALLLSLINSNVFVINQLSG